MVTAKWVVLLSFLSSLQSVAADNPKSRPSRFDVQQHLFGGTNNALSPRLLPDDEEPRKKKTTGLAAIYSLLLPGMGELYAGNFESGKYFLIAEGALWLTYATFEIHGNQLRDDSRAFARAHAGVNPAGKEEQYFIDIGNFLNIDEYNDKKLRDREPERLYNPADGFAWQWDSDFSRATFRDQRIASENMYNNRKFIIAAVLINHVGSAINAVRGAIIHNKSLNDTLGELDIRADVMGGWIRPHGIMLTMTKKF
ncbi:MAG: hypothetical protein HW412_1508 [Bacteroidetes bacterium]|nr:hypothetical protein [Bacteroidota bacterium]